jgi:hypothetical protein
MPPTPPAGPGAAAGSGPALYAEPAGRARARAILLGLAASDDVDVETRLSVLEALDVLAATVPAGAVQPEVTATGGTLQEAWGLLDEAARAHTEAWARTPLSIAAGCVRRALEDSTGEPR